MGIVLAMSIFFVIVTMVFVTIALLLPEWMGITGKKAKKIIAEQQQEQTHEQEPKKEEVDQLQATKNPESPTESSDPNKKTL